MFSVITILLLEQFRAGSRRSLWFLPLLTLVWANLHGTFILAFLFLGVYALDFLMDRTRLVPMIIVGVLMALATLINPYGLRIYSEILRLFSRSADRNLIMEWQSPNLHQPYGMLLLIAALATMALLGLRTRSLAPSRLALPILLVGLAFYSSRNIAVFAVLLPFMWNNLLPASAPSPGLPTHPQPWLSGLSLGLLIFSVAAFTLRLSANLPVYSPPQGTPMPVGAVQYLSTVHPPGPLFNNYLSGGYLVWALPEYPVFVDSRSDIYGDEIILQSLTIENALPGWQDLVTRWHFGIILIPPDSALSAALSGLPGWQQCYREPGYAVFLRTDRCPDVAAP